MTNKSLKVFEEKIIKNLDYDFLKKIQNRFPSNNAYFLVCLSEVIFTAINEDSADKNAAFDELLESFIRKAEKLYNSSNISESLQSEAG